MHRPDGTERSGKTTVKKEAGGHFDNLLKQQNIREKNALDFFIQKLNMPKL